MSRQLSKTEELHNTYVDERVQYLLPKFEALAPYKINQRKKGVANLDGWEQLAVYETRLLKLTYPDDKPEHEKTYGTCLAQITKLKKALKLATKTQLKDEKLFHSVNTIITHFGNALSFQFRQYKIEQNTQYREKVEERRTVENRVEIDLTNSLRFSNSVLRAIKNGEDANWMDVSSAIALCTGRRMSEVHLSASFEQVGDYEVIFKGHLKGKDRKIKVADKKLAVRNYGFRIPTLLPAELVCHALQWLDEKGKRFPVTEDPERVNRRWSKVLNLHVKDWDIFPPDERTYHKFRAAYFRACVENDPSVDKYDFVDYAQRILGDQDETTINSYKRYVIKPRTITKI